MPTALRECYRGRAIGLAEAGALLELVLETSADHARGRKIPVPDRRPGSGRIAPQHL